MRKRIKRTTATPVGSSDFKHVQALREILRAGHEKRQQEISLMSFEAPKKTKDVLPKYRRYYTMCWETKVYISYDQACEFTKYKSATVFWE